MTTSLLGKSALALCLTSVFMASNTVQADQPIPPPPVAFEVGKDGATDPAITYHLIGPDTVEQLKVHGGGKPADIVIYDFTTEEAHYFQLHNHDRDTDMIHIAVKPFRGVDEETLAHAQVMGCKAALQKRDPEFNEPYKKMSLHYLKTYCPHP